MSWKTSSGVNPSVEVLQNLELVFRKERLEGLELRPVRDRPNGLQGLAVDAQLSESGGGELREKGHRDARGRL
ncbi:hypothetical protein [Streptomyces cinereoruber]|uniref:hypothetical protein n=1 Tax=Streptomyces cinereoruber TaxID=67260 RepID=UPI003399DC4C